MSWPDAIILMVFAGSATLSFFRGFVREAISLLTWIAAFLAARILSVTVAESLLQWLDPASIRIPVAFIGLMIVIMLIGAILKHVANQLIDTTGLETVDRVLGVGFGLARGLVLVLVGLVVLARLTKAPESEWWQTSLFVPRLAEFEAWLGALAQALWQLFSGSAGQVTLTLIS